MDETYIGGLEEGKRGRPRAGASKKALVVIAAEEDGPGVGRIRLKCLSRASAEELLGFVQEVAEPEALVRTDGWECYRGLTKLGHAHVVDLQKDGLPRVHRVASLLKRWLVGTHQGAVSREQLGYYLDEFTFRFNRRTSKSRGKLFYRLLQQAVQVAPVPQQTLMNEANVKRHNRNL